MRLPLLLLALVALSGCQPKIGDSCDVDSDCSQTGERICDSTQPGGYCTIFGCDPTSCPEDESVCVAFGNTPSVVNGCNSSTYVSPYVRNFCMKKCGGDDDCRSGYLCVDMSVENPWGADVITSNPPTTKICVYPYSGAPPEDTEDRSNGYCTASGAGGTPGSLGGSSSTAGASPGGMSGFGGAQ